MLREHAEKAAAAQPVELARLLPGFDMWVIGAAREAVRQQLAAHMAECKRLLSEDLHAGASFDGVQVENPFAA